MTFDTTINIGHLVEILLIIASALAAYYRLDKRLALLEQKVSWIWSELHRQSGQEE